MLADGDGDLHAERERRAVALDRCPGEGHVRRIERPAPQDVAAAEEARDELGTRAFVHLLGSADLLDAPGVHDGDPVGGRHRLALVVGDVDAGVAVGVVQPAHLEPHLLAQVGVEARERFVEQQRVGFDDQRAGERDALLLPAGKLPRVPLRERGEVRGRQDGRDLPGDGGPIELPHLEAVGDVLDDRHVRPERVRLEHHRDVALLGRQSAAGRGHHAIAEEDLPAGRLDETGDQAQRGGLAAAGRPEQADQLPMLDLERDAVERGLVAEALREPAQDDRRHGDSYLPVNAGLRFSRNALRPST